jgi:hypothetical protein
MCSVSDIWQAERFEVSGVFLSGARSVFADASGGRGSGSGTLFEAKAEHD